MEVSFSPLVGIAGAAVLGGAIGIQRQAASKPAGFRTHLIVAAAAATFTAIGAHLNDTRIPSYIVVGIGFLGSGAIVREGATPQGLTTAASIWMVAAIGMAMGYANSFGVMLALLATILTLFALMLSDSDVLRVFGIPRKATIRVIYVSRQTSIGEIAQMFRSARIPFEASDLLSIQSEGGEQIAELSFVIQIPRKGDLNAIVREVAALSGVRKVEAREPIFAH